MLWYTGCGANGQLGLNYTVAKELTPQRVERLCGKGVRKVVCGRYHTLALTGREEEGGEVWAFGDNGRGQAGLGTTLIVPSPERIGEWW